MTPRAPALPPPERRAAIIAAASPLLLEDPVGFTTRAVAEAAGIAEGTIFRHFANKAELVTAVSCEALDPDQSAAQLRALTSTDLTTRVTEILDILRAGIEKVTKLFAAMMAATDTSPGLQWHHDTHRDRMRTLDAAIADALAPFADQFTQPTAILAQLLRGLAFATSHPMHRVEADTRTVVHVFLHGVTDRKSVV